MQALPEEKVRRCSFCNEDALTMCLKCGRWFCLDHASDLEPTKHCNECLKGVDALLEVAPLVDGEGVRHQGRVIRPVGVVFSQNGKLIHEMTDLELTDYIKFYQQAVHDCERSLDYARITLGNALYVAGDREIAKIQRSTGEVVFISKPTSSVGKVTKQRKPKVQQNEDAIIEFMMKNLTPEQLAKLLANRKKA